MRYYYKEYRKCTISLARCKAANICPIGAPREHFLSRVEGERNRKKAFANSSLKLGERRAVNEQLSLARSRPNTSLLIVGTNCLSPLSRSRGHSHVRCFPRDNVATMNRRIPSIHDSRVIDRSRNKVINIKRKG